MKNLRIPAAVLLAAAAFAAPAADCDILVAETWIGGKGRIGGADVGATTCPTEHLALKFGISRFEYEDTDARYPDFAFHGLTGSLRLKTGRTWMPYVGVGVLAGVGELMEYASSDGRDNDEDGVIDEPGELRELEDEFSAFLYPEAGLMYAPRRGAGFSLTARRYYGDGLDGAVIYGAGVTFRFR